MGEKDKERRVYSKEFKAEASAPIASGRRRRRPERERKEMGDWRI